MDANLKLTNTLYFNTLSDTLTNINDLLNYGKKFLNDVISSSKITKEADKVLILWFRDVVELIHGSLCLYQGQSFNNCKVLVRSLFEHYLNFKYVFKDDKNIDIKLRSYRYFQLMIILNEYNNMLRNPVYPSKNFNLTTMKRDYPLYEAYMKQIKQEITSELYSDLYNDVTKNFKYQSNKAYRQLFDKNPIQWYTLTNPSIKSISRLANYLDEKDLYIVFYKSYSKIIHAGNALSGLMLDANSVKLKNFNQPEEMMTSFCFMIALITKIYDLYMGYFSLVDKNYSNNHSVINEDLNNIFTRWNMIEKIINN